MQWQIVTLMGEHDPLHATRDELFSSAPFFFCFDSVKAQSRSALFCIQKATVVQVAYRLVVRGHFPC